MPGIREGFVMQARGRGGDGVVLALQPQAGQAPRHAEVKAAAAAGVGPAQVVHPHATTNPPTKL